MQTRYLPDECLPDSHNPQLGPQSHTIYYWISGDGYMCGGRGGGTIEYWICNSHDTRIYVRILGNGRLAIIITGLFEVLQTKNKNNM